MPCRQVATFSGKTGFGQSAGGGYATEAECLEACKEGACCDGTTCSVKPQCQCNAAAGEVFKGVGTVCSPSPCGDCPCPDGSRVMLPDAITLTFAVGSLTPLDGSAPPGAAEAAAAAVSELSVTVAKSAAWDYHVSNLGRTFCVDNSSEINCCDGLQDNPPQPGACVRSSLLCNGSFSGAFHDEYYCEAFRFRMSQVYTSDEVLAACNDCSAGSPLQFRVKLQMSLKDAAERTRVPFSLNLGDPCSGVLAAQTVAFTPLDDAEIVVGVHAAEVPGCPRQATSTGGVVSEAFLETWRFIASDMTMTITPVYENPLP